MFRNVLMSCTQPEICSILFVVRTRTAKKCTKMKKARAGRAFFSLELLFCGVLVGDKLRIKPGSEPGFEPGSELGSDIVSSQDSSQDPS